MWRLAGETYNLKPGTKVGKNENRTSITPPPLIVLSPALGYAGLGKASC